MAKKNKKNDDKKNNNKNIDEGIVPVLNNPSETIWGKVVIWIILIAMIAGALAALLYYIFASAK